MHDRNLYGFCHTIFSMIFAQSTNQEHPAYALILILATRKTKCDYLHYRQEPSKPETRRRDATSLCGANELRPAMLREESLIFFIRNIQEPDTPFVTVEYSLKNMKILQCYGEHDNKPNKDVLHYVNKVWLPYANKILKRIAA